jgi:hypothetical protein
MTKCQGVGKPTPFDFQGRSGSNKSKCLKIDKASTQTAQVYDKVKVTLLTCIVLV